MIPLDSPGAVQAAAGLFSGLVAAGHTPPVGMFRALIAAARGQGMLRDPAVLLASKWQDWLHPRGKDGRFIEKGAFVNVFADPHALLNDRSAVRRRARIRELQPAGALVDYFDATQLDAEGNPTPIPADPANGFPDQIPVDALAQKVSTAPQAIAKLQPRESAQKEHDDALVPALTKEEYDSELAGLNESIAQLHPEQAAVVSTGQGSISDADFKAHDAFISQVNQMATGHGLTWDRAFKDSFGLWSEPMQEMFDALVDEVYAEVTANQTKPKNRRAIMLGGLPGAGKTFTLDEMRKSGAFAADEWVIANPDNFKDKMLEKGLHPTVTGLAPAETAGFIHGASSEMNHMLEQLLTAEGYNVIFDITMGGQVRPGEKNWTAELVQGLEALEYAIDGIFVDVSTTTSLDRVQQRHRDGLDKLRTGASDKGPDDPEITYGGRVVPDAVISKSMFQDGDPDGQAYKSHNARNFDQVKSMFARWAVWDNTGKAPEYNSGTAANAQDKDNLPGYYPAAQPAAAAPGGGGAA